MKYRPITELTALHLPDGTTVYKESSLQGFGALGMADPNRGKKLGNTMSTVGSAIAVIVPVGTIVGGIMAAAGALISAFSNSKKTQQTNANAQGYEEANAELQNQNQQLDQKISQLQVAIENAKDYFGVDTSKPLKGLGWCLINCAKNDAKARLDSAKKLNDQLLIAQNDRFDILQKLTDEAQRLFAKKNTVNYVYIGAGVLVLGALGYFLTKRTN